MIFNIILNDQIWMITRVHQVQNKNSERVQSSSMG